MNSITQEIQYKQSLVKYFYRFGVTKAAIKFKMYRKTIYRWREKYDGTAKSLKDKSRRPHSHPNQHTEEELKMIRNFKNKNKETGLVVLRVKLRKNGYKRRVESLYRVMVRMGIYIKTPRHNGKVEISHRKDQERFYYKRIFKSFEDLVNKGKRWLKKYNNFPMKPLNQMSLREKIKEYIKIG